MVSFKEFIEEIEPSLEEGYFRYRKKVKIFPGVKLNITNKGVSGLSVGKKGKKALFTAGKRGIRHSFHLGKGLSFIAAKSGKGKSKGSIQRARKGTNRKRPVRKGNIG